MDDVQLTIIAPSNDDDAPDHEHVTSISNANQDGHGQNNFHAPPDPDREVARDDDDIDTKGLWLLSALHFSS